MPTAAPAYAGLRSDRVRDVFERAHFGRLIPTLLREAGGGELLDLGCADGLAAELAGERLTRYCGLDLDPRAVPGEPVAHDLRHGLGPVGERPFDLYLGTFGVASHLGPGELARLLGDIARHARRGSLVALEALGLRSLEWPRLWSTEPGRARELSYQLSAEVTVHPWAPEELRALYADAGIKPLAAVDRTLQPGPKTGEAGYWPGLPRLRSALDALLGGCDAQAEELRAPLPPLPAGRAAAIHHLLAERRAELLGAHRGTPAGLARGVWALEPRTSGGYGHGLLLVGRVT